VVLGGIEADFEIILVPDQPLYVVTGPRLDVIDTHRVVTLHAFALTQRGDLGAHARATTQDGQSSEQTEHAATRRTERPTLR
jgi:hypothetical protein